MNRGRLPSGLRSSRLIQDEQEWSHPRREKERGERERSGSGVGGCVGGGGAQPDGHQRSGLKQATNITSLTCASHCVLYYYVITSHGDSVLCQLPIVLKGTDRHFISQQSINQSIKNRTTSDLFKRLEGGRTSTKLGGSLSRYGDRGRASSLISHRATHLVVVWGQHCRRVKNNKLCSGSTTPQIRRGYSPVWARNSNLIPTAPQFGRPQQESIQID